MFTRLLKSIFITLIIIFLSGCTVTQFHYTSTADIPHYTSSTETEMNVILNDGDNSRNFGVLAAIDNEETEYLLITSKSSRSLTRNRISDFNISQATYIDLEAAQKFSNSLQRIIYEWDFLRDHDGFFYEFASAPITDIQQPDEYSIRYSPSVRFFFNVTNEGSIGELIIEHRNNRTNTVTSRSFAMNRRANIEDLQSLIQNGLDFFDR